MERIIPDSSSSADIKLNFSNLFAFLSSLDYLAFLEKSGAFEDMPDTGYLYYTEEKTQLWLFVIKEYLKWVSFAYLVVSLSFTIILKLSLISATLIASLLYGLLSIWIVQRYLWGRGYLYAVLRDFLWASFLCSLFMWLGLELFVFGVVPKLWFLFESWLFSGKPNNIIDTLLKPPAEFFYYTVKAYLSKIELPQELLRAFFLTLPLKVFAFLVPIFYFYYLRKHRGTTRDYYMSLIRKLPDLPEQ